MSEKKAISMRDNFRKYFCFKLLACSFESNFKTREDYIESDVDVIVFGFQTQPYIEFFSELGEADGMRPDDEETLDLEREKILDYLKRKGLL